VRNEFNCVVLGDEPSVGTGVETDVGYVVGPVVGMGDEVVLDIESGAGLKSNTESPTITIIKNTRTITIYTEARDACSSITWFDEPATRSPVVNAAIHSHQ
jgi:hypothetical protein